MHFAKTGTWKPLPICTYCQSECNIEINTLHLQKKKKKEMQKKKKVVWMQFVFQILITSFETNKVHLYYPFSVTEVKVIVHSCIH